MKTLYFDCFAGASGNMILGALVALGVEEGELISRLKLLDAADFAIEFTTKDKSGIAALHALVEVPEENAHRQLSTIKKIINDSRLTDSIKETATKIFTNLATAEAKIHGIDAEKVHFHEVGAMDAIVDVVGACIGFEILGIERFVCSKIHVGSGFAKMAHGTFPVPPPAVAELLQGFPVYSTDIEGELITPTGAAIIATVCEEFGPIPEMTIERTAYGAGTRDYKNFSNVLRLILGEDEKDELRITNDKLRRENDSRFTIHDSLVLIETNIDDSSPQILGFVMERVFEIGALDCWFTPIQMKKNRPAAMISILCERADKNKFTELLYAETPTLGVRVAAFERKCLEREIVKIETAFGAIDFKLARRGGKIINAKPEYEQLREIALERKIALREIEQAVTAEFRRQTGE